MTTLQEGYIDASGVNIHYYRANTHLPSVVFLHGIVEYGLCWERLSEIIHKDYDVIMVDARGHGRSDTPPSGYAPENHAGDVAALITQLNLDRPVLIGHSMGANTAALTAAQYPDRIGGLILEDPPWWEKDSPEMSGIRTAMAEKIHASILQDSLKSLCEVITSVQERYPCWHADDCLHWAIAKKQVRLEILSGMHQPRPPWQEFASRIQCPTLLITGEPSLGAIITPEVAAEALTLIPQAVELHIANAGHNVRRDKFESYTRGVRAFLNSLQIDHPTSPPTTECCPEDPRY